MSTGAQHVRFSHGAYDPSLPLIIDPVLVYASQFSATASVQRVAVDTAGDVYLTGLTQSTDFPTSPAACQRRFSGGHSVASDAFVTKLNSTGTALIYSSYLGGSGFDDGDGIAVDADFPTTPGALQRSLAGSAVS